MGNSNNSKGNPIDLKTGHPLGVSTVTQRNTLADSVPNPNEGEVTLCPIMKVTRRRETTTQPS
jgi:hypothetical protein